MDNNETQSASMLAFEAWWEKEYAGCTGQKGEMEKNMCRHAWKDATAKVYGGA